MAVKYVKDFSFPASGGFHGDVQRYAKGGHVTKVPAKAKASAKDMPARAKPNAPAKGAPKMESKPKTGKGQGYNEGGRVPGYDMDRLPAKKPPGRGMDLAPSRRFKGAYEGYADGGDVKPIDYSDMPVGVMGGGDEYWNPGGIKDQQAERFRQWEISKGLRPPDSAPAPRLPLPTGDAPIKSPIDFAPKPIPGIQSAASGPYVGPGPNESRISEEYPQYDMMPIFDNSRFRSEPRHYVWSDGTYNYQPEETGRRTPVGALSQGLRWRDPRSKEPVYARDVETQLDRGVRPGQMARQQRVEDRVNAARQAMFEDKAPNYSPPPEEPRYLVPVMPPQLPGISITDDRESIMPVREPSMAMVAPPSPGRFAKGGKVQKVMREYKEGKLHSGSKKGPLVKNEKQAIAIALSEARKAGAKIPKKAEGGEIYSTEYMAYESKGPKTRGTARKGRELGRQDRRAREAMERAERKAPGMSLDMKSKGGMPVHRRKPMYGTG
jgi:hypothetical protein